MRLRDWIETFRFLHEKARSGKLGQAEVPVYRELREDFARLLLAAQCLTVPPGQTARGSLRAARPVALELMLPSGTVRAATLDISAGGFSTFVPVALRAGERLDFSLDLTSGALRGRARVVNVSDEGTAYRISFALEGVGRPDADRMETEVLDAALQQFEFFNAQA